MEWRLAFAGVLIHGVLIYSIFDIYYTSPIVTDVPAHEITNNNAPAKRLVVISADGLRLDTFYQHSERSPFLHSLIKEHKGIYATSRSHVPTESRPGHIAIFAGFTEDVSAVARGWKYNPVKFDSIFNRSSEAWLWGSPDIVSLFDSYHNVHLFTYSEDLEDFGTSDAYKLDNWVFNNVERFFEEAKNDSDLLSRLMSNKRVFFLHLLGLDTNGHGNKPHSEEYLSNIEVVDHGIERLQRVFHDFFNDQYTAWVFTADHGMTDWGSHGAGSDEEVLTPFVAWGAGIRKGGISNPIAQIDLAPLFACLIGVPVPINSMGILPLHVLDVPPQYLYKSSFSNFLQLKEQFMVLRTRKARRLFFKDFYQFGLHSLKSLEAQLIRLGKLRRFSAASTLFVENAPYIRMGILYFHRYDRFFLGAGVGFCFLLWIALIWCYLISGDFQPIFTKATIVPNKKFIGLLVFMLLLCLYCQLPGTNYIYLLLPLYLFSLLTNILSLKTSLYRLNCRNSSNRAILPQVSIQEYVIGLVLLGISLSISVAIFMDRRFLSLLFIFLNIVPNVFRGSVVQKWSKIWHVCCMILIPFPFFPNVGKSELPWLCTVTPLIFACILSYISRHPIFMQKRYDLRNLSVLMLVTAGIIFLSSYMFQKPPTFLRFISWCTLPLSLILPLFSPSVIFDRCLWYICLLFVPYSLLSIAYESIFILCFLPLLVMFLRFEFDHLSDIEFLLLPNNCHLLSEDSVLRPGQVTMIELRRAALCLSFVLSTLFGTGNFASMNSFNPSTLSRFISVFSPFTMAALLLFKLFIPLLMVSLILAAVLRFNRETIKRFSCLVLIHTDLMAMCFFYLLKDDGSWLDIGLSISHYLISMFMSVALLLLLICSSNLMTISLSIDDLQIRTTSSIKNSRYFP